MTISANQIRKMTAALREVDLDKIERRLIAAAKRDGVVAAHDGYPTSTLGDGTRSAATWDTTDEHGEPDPVETTSTERAAVARAEGKQTDDPLHHNLVAAMKLATTALAAVRGIEVRLDRIDRDSADPDTVRPERSPAEPQQCCEPTCEETAVRGGRCRPCYQWRWNWSKAHDGEPAPPVPVELIDRRRQDRLYVSGPAVDEFEGTAA